MSSKIFTPVIVDSNMAAPNAGTRASVLFKADSFNQNGSIMISLVLFFLGEFLETVCQGHHCLTPALKSTQWVYCTVIYPPCD